MIFKIENDPCYIYMRGYLAALYFKVQNQSRTFHAKPVGTQIRVYIQSWLMPLLTSSILPDLSSRMQRVPDKSWSLAIIIYILIKMCWFVEMDSCRAQPRVFPSHGALIVWRRFDTCHCYEVYSESRWNYGQYKAPLYCIFWMIKTRSVNAQQCNRKIYFDWKWSRYV